MTIILHIYETEVSMSTPSAAKFYGIQHFEMSEIILSPHLEFIANVIAYK